LKTPVRKPIDESGPKEQLRGEKVAGDKKVGSVALSQPKGRKEKNIKEHQFAKEKVGRRVMPE